MWDIRGSDRAAETWDFFPGGLAAFDVHAQCGVFAGWGPYIPRRLVMILTRIPQAFCPVVLELAESACCCSFNTTLYRPFHCEYEHGPDDVSNPGIPVSVYTTIELDRISPN